MSFCLWERPSQDDDGGPEAGSASGDEDRLQRRERTLLEVLVANRISAGSSWGKLWAARAGASVAVLLTAGLLCVAPRGAGQTAGINQGGPDYVHAPAGMNPIPQHGSQGGSTVDQMRLAEQHRRILLDTAKLVELSNQLKAALDQTPKDQLSVDVLRKAEEIEKTAHDLKGWMKN